MHIITACCIAKLALAVSGVACVGLACCTAFPIMLFNMVVTVVITAHTLRSRRAKLATCASCHYCLILLTCCFCFMSHMHVPQPFSRSQSIKISAFDKQPANVQPLFLSYLSCLLFVSFCFCCLHDDTLFVCLLLY